jgi:ribulose-5-phosphate 4-epimerase/fuculose-1-phosphate aldolase
MRVGRVKRLDYVRPGDEKAGDLIRALGGKYAAILLANHGPVVTGKDIISAVHAAEELEETAKLLIMLRGLPIRMLSEENVAELNSEFGCC